MANETLGASFSIDVTDLKAGLSQANRMIRESESEFKAAAAGMDDWRKSEEGLTAKIKSLNKVSDLQKAKVTALQAEYDRLVDGGLDPTSKAAIELRTKINNETASMEAAEKQAQDLKEALRELKKETGEVAEEAEEAAGGMDVLAAAGGAVTGALAAVGTACVAAVGAFFGLAESTREARKLMAQLETSFQTAGLSAETAENTFTELYGILGDEGAATEAAQQLAKISSNEYDLMMNTRILTGVMAEYGSSIPTEGLAEAMAATSAMGSVQGVLADALEWQGVNLDDYNAKLEAMATEEERQVYIQNTLTDLYGASADAYRENNAEVIASQKAQAELNNTLNELGAIAEPIMTTLKTLAADLLTTIAPFVQLMGEGLAGALSGAEGAAGKLAEGLTGLIETALQKIIDVAPFVIETALSLIPTLLSSLLGKLPDILRTIMLMVAQVAQGLGSMLPTLIPVAISAVVQLAETLIDNIDLIIDAAIELVIGLADGIIFALPDLLAKVPIIINKLVTALVANLPKILAMGAELVIKLAMGIVSSIPQLVAYIPQIIAAIVGGLVKGISQISEVGGDIIRGLWDGISDMSSWIGKKIQGFGESVLGGIKDFFGIHSPSKVMADEVGKNLALGIGKGFSDNIAGVNKQITGAMTFGGGAGVVGTIGGRAGGVVVNQYNTYSQTHSRVELYKTKQATAAAVRLAMTGA